MPSKKRSTKPRARRKRPALPSNPLKPLPASPPSAAAALPAPPADCSRETGILPAAALLDAKRLLLQAKRYRLRRPERLAESMRRIGLDESAIAAGYADALAKLQKGNADDSVEKSLLDILKECARILEPPRPADRSASIDVNTVVQLVHKVDRPLRQPAQPPAAAEPFVAGAIEPIAADELPPPDPPELPVDVAPLPPLPSSCLP
jgi:hypothetical protein